VPEVDHRHEDELDGDEGGEGPSMEHAIQMAQQVSFTCGKGGMSNLLLQCTLLVACGGCC